MCSEVLHYQVVLYYDENTPVGIRLAIQVARARHKTSFEGQCNPEEISHCFSA